ncbi:MAG: DUF1848 domain-containing protein [Candidatus Rifleibacteriota bacterium]
MSDMREQFIISASRRTDIPAFYGEWFLNRLKAGYCLVKNPFNPKQISKVSLKKEDVAAFIFWTRNPMPFMSAVDKLLKHNYHFGFFVTLTDYPRSIELNKAKTRQVINAIQQLSEKIGSEKIVWRYDPIILSNKFNFAWHLNNFKKLADRVSPYVEACFISFVDFYKKTLLNLKQADQFDVIANPLPEPGLVQFLQALEAVCRQHDLPIYNCCEPGEIFDKAGIESPGCINPEWLKKITDKNFNIKKHKGQRKDCRCVFSRDIGAYNTCLHGCLYCYATRNHKPAGQRKHNPLSEFL